jgi:hypothetical protein
MRRQSSPRVIAINSSVVSFVLADPAAAASHPSNAVGAFRPRLRGRMRSPSSPGMNSTSVPGNSPKRSLSAWGIVTWPLTVIVMPQYYLMRYYLSTRSPGRHRRSRGSENSARRNGDPDGAEPAFAEPFEQLVRTDPIAHLLGFQAGGLRLGFRRPQRFHVEKFGGVVVRAQEFIDFGAKGSIRAACFIEKAIAFAPQKLDCLVKDALCTSFGLGAHSGKWRVIK